MSVRDLPRQYVAALAALLVLAVLWVLTWLGVPPFDNITVFLLTNILGLLAVVVLGVLGGAFVGLMLAHRIFSARDFSPFERAMVERLSDIQARQEAIEARLAALDEKKSERGVVEKRE